MCRARFRSPGRTGQLAGRLFAHSYICAAMFYPLTYRGVPAKSSLSLAGMGANELPHMQSCPLVFMERAAVGRRIDRRWEGSMENLVQIGARAIRSLEVSGHPVQAVTSAFGRVAAGAVAVILLASVSAASASPVHFYGRSFGSEGAGPGQFEEPSSVAVEEVALGDVGDVYVADSGNHRVERFSAEGTEFLGQFNGTETPAGSFTPTAVAVDNSTDPLDPSKGDVYVVDREHAVVDKFDPNGKYIGMISTGAGGVALERIRGVAVSPEGVVWIEQGEGEIDSYSAALSNAFLASITSPFGEGGPGLAVDANNNLYVDGGPARKINGSGEPLIEEMGAGAASAVAVDQATNEVYIDESHDLSVFNAAETCTAAAVCSTAPAGSLVERVNLGVIAEYAGVPVETPAPGLEESQGVTVDASTGMVYLTDVLNKVQVFPQTSLPVIDHASVTNVGVSQATVSASVDAHGTPSATYSLEYGTTSAYGASTAAVDAGEGREAVRLQLTGLTPGTTYHARVVATNEFGTSHGADLTFTTESNGSTDTLADGRGYELVSPNTNIDANVYVEAPYSSDLQDLYSASPFRAAADGEAIAYVAEAQPVGGAGSTGNGFGDQFVAKRGPEGWTSQDIMPPRLEYSGYEGFSNTLSIGVLTNSSQPAIGTDAPANCDVVYLHTAGAESFQPAFTTTLTPGECGIPVYAGISADESSVIFESEAALVGGATQGGYEEYNLYETVAGHTYLVSVLPDGEATDDATFGISFRSLEGNHDFDRVISADGSRVVWTDLDTAVGPENPGGTTRLLVRENATSAAATTVQVDAAVGGGGQYEGAGDDDSLIYFTKGEHLYRYDLETAATTDMTPSGGVVGVAGISDDGSEAYVVAKTVLAANENSDGAAASAGSCELARSSDGAEEVERLEEEAGILPEGRACNLYMLQDGKPSRFIATLLPEDDASKEGPVEFGGVTGWYGDWAEDLALRTTEVAQDGKVLAFMSKRSLTGYDNNGLREIFLYDASDEQLTCVSCDPSGAVAEARTPHSDEHGSSETFVPVPFAIASSTYQYRWVSANGNRVFFDTTEALVPQDTNDNFDVYEWERGGEGSCRQAAGCIYLISGDTSRSEGLFVDASEDGDDVFFTSRADLTPQDQGENVVLYDARVGGGFSQVTSGCIGTGCQGVPPAPPSFATPPSLTFGGSGNYAPVAALKPKPKTAAQIRAEHLAKALKLCRAKSNKAKRAACERVGRKRYGSVKEGKSRKQTHVEHNNASDNRRAAR